MTDSKTSVSKKQLWTNNCQTEMTKQMTTNDYKWLQMTTKKSSNETIRQTRQFVKINSLLKAIDTSNDSEKPF